MKRGLRNRENVWLNYPNADRQDVGIDRHTGIA
jgi:hypothetical protein